MRFWVFLIKNLITVFLESKEKFSRYTNFLHKSCLNSFSQVITQIASSQSHDRILLWAVFLDLMDVQLWISATKRHLKKEEFDTPTSICCFQAYPRYPKYIKNFKGVLRLFCRFSRDEKNLEQKIVAFPTSSQCTKYFVDS